MRTVRVYRLEAIVGEINRKIVIRGTTTNKRRRCVENTGPYICVVIVFMHYIARAI